MSFVGPPPAGSASGTEAGALSGYVVDKLTNPAAGSGWTWTAPGNYTSEIHAIVYTLTTSVTVANRFCHIIAKDTGGITLWDLVTSGPQAASITGQYLFSVECHTAYANGNGGFVAPCIPIPLSSGLTVQMTCDNLQAADAATNIRIVYLRSQVAGGESDELFYKPKTVALPLPL